MKKAGTLIAILLLCTAGTVPAREGGKFSMIITSGLTIPVGADSTSMFTLGGGAELTGAYSMPFAPFLFAKGLLDYTAVPSLAKKPLSLISIGAGAGVEFYPFRFMSVYASAGGGYGLGLYDGNVGGSPFMAAEGGIFFHFNPTFGLGAGAGYRHYFSQPVNLLQGVKIHIGTHITFGAGQREPNIQIFDIQFDPIFPVFYKHYDDHSLGTVTLKNSENGTIEDVKVSLFISQYMDKPKQSIVIEKMAKDEETSVPLFALFSDSVLSITEGTKVAAEVITEYKYRDNKMSTTETQTLRLYDRNAMTWDDDRKAAAFCTAKDPEILRFSKNIAGMVRDHHSTAVNLNFRIGMGLFEGLNLQGISYVVDPQTPYEDFSKNTAVVDYLQFPVQTLEYKAGDCDDLSILYASLLESIGIETAFITIPGHIFMAFSLQMPPDEAKTLFLNPGDLIFIDNTTWLPVEITLVREGFLKAWETGAKEWREHNPSGNAGFFPVHDAWKEYEPVGLTGAATGLSFPEQNTILDQYSERINRFVEREIADKVAELQGRIEESKEPARLQNRLAVLYARYGILEKARSLFETAANSQFVPAVINMGNILYLEGKMNEALKYFEEANEMRPGSPAALVGIAKTNYELENHGNVKRAYEELQRKDPDAAARFSYLVSGGGEEARASAAMIRQTVLWDEE